MHKASTMFFLVGSFWVTLVIFDQNEYRSEKGVLDLFGPFSGRFGPFWGHFEPFWPFWPKYCYLWPFYASLVSLGGGAGARDRAPLAPL